MGISDDVVNLDAARGNRFDAPVERHHLRLPPVIEERLHRLGHDDLALQLLTEDDVKNPARADRRVVGPDPGSEYQKRDVFRRLIEQIAVLQLAMIAQPFAVIANDDHRPVK